MSLIKGKQVFRTILDFSEGKVTKTMVRQLLSNTNIQELVPLPDTTEFTFVENNIKIGIFTIRLLFNTVSLEERNRLREYGMFRIGIYEDSGKTKRNINNHKLFKKQYWSDLNKDYSLRINDLANVIMYLKRLDDLRAFL